MRVNLLVPLALFVSLTATFAQDSAPDKPLTRIALGSCNKEYKPQPLWKPILACKPDLWIWLGDIVYGDADDLTDLARRYKSEKEQADYKALRAQCRVIGIWDDADYGVGDGGKDNPNKTATQQLLLDFLDEPAESPRRKQAGAYAAYTFGPAGQQVKIILLDGRFHRERPDRNSDILGEEQWAWLEQQLTNSSADIHFIGSGIQVLASEHRYEKWADFPKAKQRLLDLVAKTKPRNVIFLSGDRHLGEISRLDDPKIGQPLYDITSSGMTHHAENNFFHNFSKETNNLRRGSNYVDLNFGLIAIDWATTPPVVSLQVRGVDNAVAVEEKLTLAGPVSAPVR